MVKKVKVYQNKKALYVLIALILLLIVIILFVKFQNNNSGLANPASVYCIEQGGKLEIRTDANSGQYGVCLKNNKECDEWAYYNRECSL